MATAGQWQTGSIEPERDGLGPMPRGMQIACAVVALLIAGVVAVTLRHGDVPAIAAKAPTGIAAVTLQSARVDVGIYPGSRVTLSTLAVNRSDRPVRIGAVLVDRERGTSGFVTKARNCRLPLLTYEPQDNGGRGWVVPARANGDDGELRIRLPHALSMGLLATPGCFGTDVTVYLVPRA